MPWTAESFAAKHNKELNPSQRVKAASIANAVLKKSGNEASAIRIANAAVKRRLTKGNK
jgi:uncharacterized protein YdaT